MVQLAFILFLLPVSLLANDLQQIRKEYYAAVNNEEAAEKLYRNLKSKNSGDPIMMAYYGAAQAVRARHTINPYNKVSYLKSGMKVLNAAAEKSPDNLEIRFLRLSLEHYIPAFLGFSRHLDADKKKIVELVKLQKFGAMDKPLLANLLSFMKDTKRCTPQEIAILDQAIKNG